MATQIGTYTASSAFAYDNRNQLTQELPSQAGNPNQYDAAGNGLLIPYGGGDQTSHSYNVDNQDAASTYDGNGNPAVYNGSGLRFDPENRLTQVGSVLSCGYNGDGQRAWKQNSSGTRTYFLYDGSQPVCEMNGSGNLTAVNDFGADGVWARHDLNSDWFYTFDPQGSVSQKVGRDGSVVCSSVHDAQGRQGTTDTHADPFSGFGGQWGYYADWETSQQGGWYCLCLLGHRFYDPGAGRFLNRDPIGYQGGVNLYAYVGNNPINRADPLGLWNAGFVLGGTVGGGYFGAGGGISGTVGIVVDGNGNVGIIYSGAGYGAGTGGIISGGVGGTGGNGNLTNGLSPVYTGGGYLGPGSVTVSRPIGPGGQPDGPTQVTVTAGPGVGGFAGGGVGVGGGKILFHLPEPEPYNNAMYPDSCSQMNVPGGVVHPTP